MKTNKMPKLILTFLLALIVLSSCKQETKTGDVGADGNNLELQNKIAQLELDNAMKDSVINESLAFFNEIKSNLQAIGIRKDEIRDISAKDEISTNDKNWILEEIKHINYLREDNARMVNKMKDQMSKNGLKIKELEVMIESLMKDIQWKDEQITLLQGELNSLDREYTVLFDAYQVQALKVDKITDEMNTVYYAYGTERELRDNGVIEKKNGFMGIGKKTELKDNLNDKYFTKMNATKKKNIRIEGTDNRFITYHPRSSYTLKEEDGATKLEIIDASEFWKISKYLVVIVD